jgi:probable rRNA maturation factor
MKNQIELPENDNFFLTQDELEKILSKLFNFLFKNKKVFLSLRIVDDKNIQEINNQSRGKNKPTDVLSFPAPNIPSPIRNLGEIIISYETIIIQAEEIGHSKVDEFYRLLVHGVLHLLGYDHEISVKEEQKMQKKEDECLEHLYSIQK